MCALLLGLVACSTGSADESRRFQAQDAEEEQQLAAAQQTHIADQLLQPTGTPIATITPSAGISRLVLTTSPVTGSSPGNTLQSVPAFQSTTIYASANLSNLQSGQLISTIWRNEDGTIVASNEVTASPSSGSQWVSIPIQLDGSWPAGIYSVAIVVNNDQLESLAFRVG